MGVAGLAAGQLRDRDGVSQGCVVRQGTELLFCSSCHELLSSTSEIYQVLSQLSQTSLYPFPTQNHQLLFSCTPALCPALMQETISQTSWAGSPWSCCFLLPRPPEMPATGFSAFLCHPTALQPGHGCLAVLFPSSSVLTTVGKHCSQWSSGWSLCAACVTPSPPALWEAGLVSQLLPPSPPHQVTHF